jgi:predicted  nucleic acid-binding Zn-ribbon protein
MTTMNEQQQELNERIADDERHAATMRKARDYDALMARAEAAEEEKYQLHKMWSAALDTCDGLRARVAELESQLAAQQWRPVTEKPEPDQEVEIVIEATFDDYGPGG